MTDVESEEEVNRCKLKEQTFTERIRSITPQVRHQGIFYGYTIKPDKERGHFLTAKLNPDQVPNLEGMKLTYIRRSFDRTTAINKKEIQELMRTTIVKDLGTIRCYLQNQICVYFSSMSSLIFTDPNFVFSEYEKIAETQGADIVETSLKKGSKIIHSVDCVDLLKKTFPTKLRNNGLVYYPGGNRSYNYMVQSDRYEPYTTDKPATIRTFEVLGKTEDPWDEPNVRSTFAEILEKDLMNQNTGIVEVKFSNARDLGELLFDKYKAFADVKDVAEKCELLDFFTMVKKVPVGKQTATVAYYKLGYCEPPMGYFLRVYGKTSKTIEGALLQLK